MNVYAVGKFKMEHLGHKLIEVVRTGLTYSAAESVTSVYNIQLYGKVDPIVEIGSEFYMFDEVERIKE